MMNCLIDPNDNDMWLEAINGKYYGGKPFERQDWDMLLGHCQVCRSLYVTRSPNTSLCFPKRVMTIDFWRWSMFSGAIMTNFIYPVRPYAIFQPVHLPQSSSLPIPKQKSSSQTALSTLGLLHALEPFESR